MLRLATEADASEIKRLSLNFYRATQYTDVPVVEEKVDAVIASFLNADKREKIIVLSDNNGVRGLIVGTVQEFLFTRDNIAVELMWWMDPEYRNSRDSLELMKAFEHWAKHIANCKLIQLSLIHSLQSDRISKLYERKGFVLAEQTYFKVL